MDNRTIINVGGKGTTLIVGTNTVDNNFPEQRAQNNNLLNTEALKQLFWLVLKDLS